MKLRGLIVSLALFIAGLICLDPPAKAWWQSVPQNFPSVWQTAFSKTLTEDSSGWSGFNLRMRFPSGEILVSGSQVRLTLASGTLVGFSANEVTIGRAASSGNAWDSTVGSLTAVTVAASGAISLTANSTVLTDASVFALNEADDFLVCAHFDALSSLRGLSPAGGADTYFKSAASECMVAAPTGYTSSIAGSLRLVAKIEALVP